MNAILSLLDDIGLPWREPRAALIARGRRSRADEDVVEIPTTRPIAPNLKRPLGFRRHEWFAGHLPVVEFTSETAVSRSARRNIETSAEAIGRVLGPMKVETQHNTLFCEWAAGSSRLSLRVWPEMMQTFGLPGGENPACYLRVQTGWRPALTEDLTGLSAVAALPDVEGTAAEAYDRPAEEHELEFVRVPVALAEGALGRACLSADGTYLVFWTHQLFVIPVRDVVRFEVDRILPAKGGGGSHLAVACRSAMGGATVWRLGMARAAGPDDLNDLGKTLAAAAERPVEIGAPTYDV